MNKFLFLISLLLSVLKTDGQYIIIPVEDSNYVASILTDKATGYKAFAINAKRKLMASEILIYAIVFSDQNGNFSKKNISLDTLTNSYLPIRDLFPIAERNVNLDENREISHFEYEGQYSKNPIRMDNQRLIIQNSDQSYSLYEDYTYIYFFEIRPFKQFTVVQSCASQINTNSIHQPMKRVKDKNNNHVVDFPDLPDNLADYFPNKLFLEKINPDSTYHFVKFLELCKDCGENDTYEFDFDNRKGIVRYWNFLPRSVSKNRIYIMLE